MKKILFLMAAVAAAALSAAEGRMRAVYTIPGELNGIVGHVQGAACSTQGVYLSHAGGIFKIGWDGRLLRKCTAPVHLGDVGYANGRLYGALALRKPIDGHKGMIRVWDEDLNVVAEHLLPGHVDGCAVIGDTLYYGLDPYGKTPHRRCQIGRLTLDFKDLGVVDTDQGGQCHYGVQTMATDGQDLFCGYYNFGTPPVRCARFDPNLKVCRGTPNLSCSEGFGRIPPSLFPSEHPRFFTVNALNGNCHKWHAMTNPPQIRLDFYEYRNGQFFDITERGVPPLITRTDFFASDPFIYTDRAAKCYRIYLQMRDTDVYGAGVQMRTSPDLQHWSLPKQVLRVPASRKCSAVEAPELHAYNGTFYLFAALEGGQPGLGIFRADSPEGPFTEWSAEPIAVPEGGVGDGTFWVEGGKPYLVFAQEGTADRGGRVLAVELTSDLKAAAGKPFELIRAADGASGPFLYRSHNGSLLLLWSSIGKTGACVNVTKSESGRLAGPWGVSDRIFDIDGGHAMLFRTLHGQLMMCLHQPTQPAEKKRTRILPVLDMGDTVRIDE